MKPAEERISEHFSPEKLQAAQKRAWGIVREAAGMMRPGMTEEQGEDVLKGVIARAGSTKFWHRPHLRFGRNTLKAYSEPSETGVVLQANDLFFMDIGPCFDGYEGDCGDTFVVGTDPEMRALTEACRKVWQETATHWRTTGATGEALYRFAADAATRAGWVLNLDVNGHRLGEFPHAHTYRGALADRAFRPEAGLWVLEIQLRHPKRELGAFYEDLLI